jgi:hypothetical protein
MKISHKLMLGEGLPRFYRESHFDLNFLCHYAYPIGIHLIVRWIHQIHQWSYRRNPTKLEALVIRAQWKGYRQGVEDEKRRWENNPAFSDVSKFYSKSTEES